MARRGRSSSEEQASRPRRPERSACRGEKKKTYVNSRAGETISGSVLCRSAAALGRENSRHCREIRSEKERRPGVVLQPAAETETNEIRGATLTADVFPERDEDREQ